LASYYSQHHFSALSAPMGLILVIGIAIAISGIGFFGSSQGSMDQLVEKIRVREARRAEMIDGMNLQVVQNQ
jgi:hypothetical protein